MVTWKRLNRKDCPICLGTRRDCRQNTATGLIHCRDVDANPADYKYIGQDSLGFGMWAEKTAAAGWTDERRREWQEKERARKDAERAQHARSLSARERDREIRKVFNQLLLADADRALLKSRRYLSDSFIWDCVSVKPWQDLTDAVNPNLAGVNRSGNKLNNPIAGILIPVRDESGLWVSMRLYNPNYQDNDCGKYTWLSSSKRNITPHLQNGENPIAVYYPANKDRLHTSNFLDSCDNNLLHTCNKEQLHISNLLDSCKALIGFTESLEFKPAIVADRLGIPVIGASGGNFGSSRQCLNNAIAKIESDRGKCVYILFPDAGSRINKNVFSQYDKLNQAIKIDFIADWGQWDDKAAGDADEIEDLRRVRLAAPEEFFERPKNAIASLTAILNLLRRPGKKERPANEPRHTYAYHPDKGLPEPEQWDKMGRPKIVYRPGDRAAAWLELTHRNYKFILDSSFMGSGKSYSIPSLADGVERLIYVSNEHRNPSIKEIKNEFADLHPRNKYGFKTDDNGKLIRATKYDDKAVIGGNCIRADLFDRLQNLGYSPNDRTDDDVNPICGTCANNEFCHVTAGLYKRERVETLAKKTIRADIRSLPRVGFDYSATVLAVDEAARQLTATRVIKTDYDKLLIECDRAREYLNPNAYAYLDGLLQSIKSLTQIKSRYGLSNPDILARLPKIDYLNDLIEVLELHSLPMDKIFPAADNVNVSGMSKEEKRKYWAALKLAQKQFNRAANTEAADNLDKIPPNGLIQILKAIRGDAGVVLRLAGDRMTITLDDRWYKEVFESAAAVLFLDATLSVERLAALSGIESDQIVEVGEMIERPPLANLTVHYVAVEGCKTANLSVAAVERIKAVLAALPGDIPVISHKAYRETFEAAGYWFRDNRASNDYQGQKAIAFIGSPFPNFGAVEDEYRAIFGGLTGLNDWYTDGVRAEQLQAVGRQRCNREPGREFHAYFIGSGIDIDFLKDYGATVSRESGLEYSPAAGNKLQALKHNLLLAAANVADKSVKLTQSALANLTGVTQGRISQILEAAGLTIKELVETAREIINSPIENSNRGINNLASDDLYRSFVGLSPLTVLEEAIEMIRAIGWKDYRRFVLDDLPDLLRIKIVSGLIAAAAPEPYQTE